ncbi:MAG TPA: hypothetical protein VGL19_02650, partial [Polyangiaceae bacterium]
MSVGSRFAGLGLVSLVSLGSVLSSIGCSSGSSSAAAGAAGAAGAAANNAGAANGGAGSGDPNALVGSFIVGLVGKTATDEAYTALSGKVYDGATPDNVAWNVVASDAGCQLLKPSTPFCDPACKNGEVCVAGDQCATYPTAQDLGPIAISGLGATSITMKAIAAGYQLPGDAVLPFPPADEGALIQLNVPGGPYGAFAITSAMVAPLASTGAVTLESGKSLTLDWDAPGQPNLARMRIKLDISHHGGTKGKIECDVADSG